MSGVFATLGFEIVITLVGVGVGVAIQRGHEALARRREERRYPVSGFYYSWYEDEEGGRAFIDKAMISLQQRGAQFTGTTALIGSTERAWVLRGEILEGRYLSGIYYHQDPGDPGRGMFFLEPDPGGEASYSGIWAGYDAVNRQVMSGRYRWKRQADVAVDRLTLDEEEDVSRALAVLGQSLGERYVTRSDVVDTVEAADGVALVARDEDGTVEGVVLGHVLADERVETLRQVFRSNGIVTSGLRVQRVGMLSTIAVRPTGRGRGHASALARACLEALEQHGCGLVLTISWDHGGDTSRGMLAAAGFETLGVIEEYWREDSLEKDYDCPSCGNPCLCSAVIMAAQL